MFQSSTRVRRVGLENGDENESTDSITVLHKLSGKKYRYLLSEKNRLGKTLSETELLFDREERTVEKTVIENEDTQKDENSISSDQNTHKLATEINWTQLPGIIRFNVYDVELGKPLEAVTKELYYKLWNNTYRVSDEKDSDKWNIYEQMEFGNSANDVYKTTGIESTEPYETFNNEKTAVVDLWHNGNRESNINVLAEAAMLAYARHYPLRLTPEVIWITIMQTLARHIRENAEHFRQQIVSHNGRKTLTVDGDNSWIPHNPNNNWKSVFPEFSKNISQNVNDPTLRDLMECEFSQTSSVDSIVSNITLMDAMQKYFNYEMNCICGIPYIELGGTLEDWDKLRTKATKLLTEFELGWWLEHLAPILDQFVMLQRVTLT